MQHWYNFLEVKNVKKLEKDFMIAWLLGMVLPAVILFAMVGFDRMENAQNSANTESTAPVVSVLPAPVYIQVLDSDGKVQEMELETYICGVVLAEMPVEFELESLKAQAVVARTYALRCVSKGRKHTMGAVCTDSACCQGHLSPEDFLNRSGDDSGVTKVSQAVLQTAGQVLLYNGNLIDATYFSCSGGRTEDAAAVWGSDVPYLKSTVSPGEEYAAYHTDTMTLSPAQVEAALGVTFTGEPGSWFRILSHTDGGGVEEVSVCGQVLSGVQIRKKLSLRSTNFTVEATESQIVFTTKGYGHRVGMSQYGADAMALSGSTYDQILAHYYQGTELARYDPGH